MLTTDNNNNSPDDAVRTIHHIFIFEKQTSKIMPGHFSWENLKQQLNTKWQNTLCSHII